jgi:hypothetical protein
MKGFAYFYEKTYESEKIFLNPIQEVCSVFHISADDSKILPGNPAMSCTPE